MDELLGHIIQVVLHLLLRKLMCSYCGELVLNGPKFVTHFIAVELHSLPVLRKQFVVVLNFSVGLAINEGWLFRIRSLHTHFLVWNLLIQNHTESGSLSIR